MREVHEPGVTAEAERIDVRLRADIHRELAPAMPKAPRHVGPPFLGIRSAFPGAAAAID